MNNVEPIKRSKYSRHFPFVGLLLLLLLLTSCFGGGNEETAVSPETAAQQTGSLVCSSSCLSQGQCGTKAADGRTVILAHSDQPTTRDHNTILPNESAITILEIQPRTVVDSANASSTLNFYKVQPASGGPAGWVADSCVNVQP